MPSADSHPHLRLVGSLDRPSRREQPTLSPPAQVAGENRAANRNLSLDPTDPRWVLAARAYSQLEGTTLVFERRQRVMRLATQLGMRPFEANIIIAIVQDLARRGADLSEATGTIALLPKPSVTRVPTQPWVRWIAAVATALIANVWLIWWLTAR